MGEDQLKTKARQVAFSGVQPSGQLTIGNYLGALKPWLACQQAYRSLFCIVDLHALTTQRDPDALRDAILDTLALYLAVGLNPHECILFVQSHVREHTQLAWILATLTGVGELKRMTQFKAKAGADQESVGLFTYPVLMAADILLYDTEVVPVGADQKQHVELCRDIAVRFNRAYGETFSVPSTLTADSGARIMALQTPTVKMSKSDGNSQNYIALLDSPAEVTRKLKRAVTDSVQPPTIRYAPGTQPGVSNLLGMLSALEGKPLSVLEQRFAGCSYAMLKTAVLDRLIPCLEEIQGRFAHYRSDRPYLEAVLRAGADSAGALAERKLKVVYDRVGLIEGAR